jgi:hypothetical protein
MPSANKHGGADHVAMADDYDGVATIGAPQLGKRLFSRGI